MTSENKGVIPLKSGLASPAYCVKSVLANNKNLPSGFSKYDMIVTSILAPYSTTIDTMMLSALLLNNAEHKNAKETIIHTSNHCVPIIVTVLIKSGSAFSSSFTPKKSRPNNKENP